MIIKGYGTKIYDERQLLDRYRISFETMWLTFLLIFASGMIKIVYGQWAADNTEMVILLIIPLTYFLVRSIWKGAYFSVDKRNYKWSLLIFAALGIFLVTASIIQITNTGAVIDNGMLTENFFQFFLAIPFLAVPVVALIKGMTEKKVEEDE